MIDIVKFGSYGSILELGAQTSLLIDQGDIDSALRLIRHCVERIITEPLCTSQVFGSRILDDLCQRAGRATLAEMGGPPRAGEPEPDGKPTYVYLVTKLQSSGGHARVVADFIRARPEGRHIILSTELDGKSDSDFFVHGLLQKVAIAFECAPRANYKKRLIWLQRRLLAIRPSRVYLFNHHQDSVAIAAAQPGMHFPISFYHHGDHHFCLGIHVSHLEHIDPHPMGFLNCRHVLGIDNTYIPLTAEDRGSRPANWQFLASGALTTCTAARSNKVEAPYFISYVDVLPDLLQATGGRHVHIGKLSHWAIFRIRRGLKRRGIRPDRFTYIPWVPSVWQALLDHKVDLYVASFPYGGGLTLIEAMGAGVPVALHRHIFSAILSGIELGYPGAFSWRFPKELLDFCKSVRKEDLAHAGRLGRLHYESWHHESGLLPNLAKTMRNPPEGEAAQAPFVAAHDEWALWATRQTGLRRSVMQTVYRTLKRMRSWR